MGRDTRTLRAGTQMVVGPEVRGREVRGPMVWGVLTQHLALDPASVAARCATPSPLQVIEQALN